MNTSPHRRPPVTPTTWTPRKITYQAPRRDRRSRAYSLPGINFLDRSTYLSAIQDARQSLYNVMMCTASKNGTPHRKKELTPRLSTIRAARIEDPFMAACWRMHRARLDPERTVVTLGNGRPTSRSRTREFYSNRETPYVSYDIKSFDKPNA